MLTRKGVCFVWKTGDIETCASVFKKDNSRRYLCREFNVRLITCTLHETKATPLAGFFLRVTHIVWILKIPFGLAQMKTQDKQRED